MQRQDKRLTLVTGGAGFLGRHLCQRLLREDHHVVCIDNFWTGQHQEMQPLLQHPSFRMVHHDIVTPLDDIDPIFRIPSLPVHHIYNLACPASPQQYQGDPVRTTVTNVTGTFNVLEFARKHNAMIFQASTSEVYGSPSVHPQTEDYWGSVNPTGPRACYDEGKRCAEALCSDYARHHNLNVKIGRIFNTYGPGMRPDDGRVVSSFIVQALRGEDITLFGNGQQTRSFCYVSDTITAFMRLMATSRSVSGPVNIGNPIETSVIELAETILQLTGSPSQLVFCTLPQDDPIRRKPDITKARHLLEWHPTVSLKDGLKETIAWFRSVL